MPSTAMAGWIERARSDGEEIPEPLGRVEVAAKTAPKTGRAGRRQERIDKRRRRRGEGAPGNAATAAGGE